MRSLELHLFETDRDVDLAISSGTAFPEQLADTQCLECDGSTGNCVTGFEPFVLVIDENDQDWTLCFDCARPVLTYVDVFFPPVTRSRFLDPDESLDYF